MAGQDRGGYISPYSTRYASEEMQRLFAPDFKFSTWRRLWLALARAEKKLGVKITQDQIEEMEAHLADINYDVAEEEEKRTRHDVMSHVYAYGVQCPTAKPIIHLGATSMFVNDNTDVIIMKEALEIVRRKLINVIANLGKFSLKYKDLPTLAYTHLQPAQPTTVGKRAALWAQDFVLDLESLDFQARRVKFLGNKGATGTQASFLELFNGSAYLVQELEKMIAKEMGFSETMPISAQTITRKIDDFVLSALSGIAQSAAKFASDIRHLQFLKEIEEPFEKGQTGSSAMAYKRNPMRSERICGLARHVITNAMNGPLTVITQWFERTLDDSANRRISMSEAFLGVDAILNLMLNVSSGLVVNQKVIEANLKRELPFMATENIMMWETTHGGDRQELHERIKELSQEAGDRIKQEGFDNNLLERILADPLFKISKDELDDLMSPEKFVGLAPSQTQEFYMMYIFPILRLNESLLGETVELNV